MAGLRSYLVGAVYQWATENGLTPFLVVNAAKPGVEVPAHHIVEGRITLNIDPHAVRAFSLNEDVLSFQARFAGTPYPIVVPISAVLAIYARENGKGLSFEGEPEDEPPPEPDTPPARKAPSLRRVK